ncbi:hypothetical protein IX83_04305 [Basilea psittacipulmonis DSM 24701]|uniref:Uncharacterized protein n=1 Tax=Basilea psittacipulmonis DSM 24701 TaxID=1072685 RepID=A0A077DCL7_9BURK|nr:hypothetical protein IX83_04305 [Basilea psittacipulmonis DSM 24701]
MLCGLKRIAEYSACSEIITLFNYLLLFLVIKGLMIFGNRLFSAILRSIVFGDSLFSTILRLMVFSDPLFLVI